MKKYRGLPLVLAFLSLGMSEPQSVPPEAEDLRVRVVDSRGVDHDLKGLLCDGDPELRLRRGTLRYRIPIKLIERIEVLGDENPPKVRVVTRGGKEEVFEVDRGMRCTARSESGSVTFYIGEVRTIEISEGVRR